MTGERPSWVDDRLFPFASQFVELDGQLVHYVDEGTGPVLLMLHGNPTWSFVYREMIQRLSSRFRCIAPDYPGFGLSVATPGYGSRPLDHARVTAAFVRHLDLRGATVVVQDWGGPIGMHVVLAERTRFSALVVANTWAWPVNGDRHFEIFSAVMGGPVGAAAIRRFNLFVNVMVPAGHRRRKVSAAEMAHYRRAMPDPARRQATAIFPRQIVAGREFLADLDARLPALADLPALLVWADRDFAFRAAELAGWQRRLPRASTVMMEGAGHFVQSDAPDDVADAIVGWYDGLDG